MPMENTLQTELSSVSTLTISNHQHHHDSLRPLAPQHNQLPQLQLQTQSTNSELSSSSMEAAATAPVKPSEEEVEYTSIMIQTSPPSDVRRADVVATPVTAESELPVETEYVTVASALSEPPPAEVAAAGVHSDGEDLSLGESVVLGDGILNNLSCDLTENLNTDRSVVALCSSRPLNLVNNSFVVDTTADRGDAIESQPEPTDGERIINIEMDTTASVI